MIDRITDHEARALGQLPEQRKQRPNVEAVVRVIARRAQSVEDMLWGVFDARVLDTAAGESLGAMGRIVGVVQPGADDDTLRNLIRVQIKLNRSAGTPDDVLGVMGLLLGNDVRLKLVEFGRASFELRAHGPMPIAGTLAARYLARARGGGIGSTFIWSDHDDADTFAFIDETGARTIEGETFGDATGPSVGGYFASAAR